MTGNINNIIELDPHSPHLKRINQLKWPLFRTCNTLRWKFGQNHKRDVLFAKDRKWGMRGHYWLLLTRRSSVDADDDCNKIIKLFTSWSCCMQWSLCCLSEAHCDWLKSGFPSALMALKSQHSWIVSYRNQCVNGMSAWSFVVPAPEAAALNGWL